VKTIPNQFTYTLQPGAKPRHIGEKYGRSFLVAKMHSRYKYGATFQELGPEFGISGEHARQLLKKAGYETVPLAERRLNGARLRSREVIAAYRGCGHIQRCAELLNMRPEHVSIILNEASPDRSLHHQYSRIDAPGERWYKNGEILNAIRAAAQIAGEPLSITRYRQIAARDGLPSILTVLRAFGTWGLACTEARIKINNAKALVPRQFTSNDCRDALRACWEDTGKIPTVKEYAAWKVGRSVPSALTITLRVGEEGSGWTAALRATFPDKE